jgi:hypothetical protein
MDRQIIQLDEINAAFEVTRKAMTQRLLEKGYGTFTSTHEALGVITEEYHELIEAIQLGKSESIYYEFVDVAVGAIFSLACMRTGSMDW